MKKRLSFVSNSSSSSFCYYGIVVGDEFIDNLLPSVKAIFKEEAIKQKLLRESSDDDYDDYEDYDDDEDGYFDESSFPRLVELVEILFDPNLWDRELSLSYNPRPEEEDVAIGFNINKGLDKLPGSMTLGELRKKIKEEFQRFFKSSYLKDIGTFAFTIDEE